MQKTCYPSSHNAVFPLSNLISGFRVQIQNFMGKYMVPSPKYSEFIGKWGAGSIYVYMFVCIYMYIYIYMHYICIHIYPHIYIYMVAPPIDPYFLASTTYSGRIPSASHKKSSLWVQGYFTSFSHTRGRAPLNVHAPPKFLGDLG